MFRPFGRYPTKLEMNAVFDFGGLGDSIARLPAIKYLLIHYPYITLNLWVPDYFHELAAHLLKGFHRLRICKFSEINNPAPMPTIDAEGYHTTLRTHLVDHGFHAYLDMQTPTPKHKNYLSIRPNELYFDLPLPEKFIVITSMFTASVRAFLPEEINKVSHWCTTHGFTPVYLGRSESKGGNNKSIHALNLDGVDTTNGIDLIDKTTLTQAALIMSKAKAVLGVDNGLLHLAACSDAFIIAAYTTVNPKLRLPYRHNRLGWNVAIIEPPSSLACRYCQSNMNFVYDHNFTNCYYDDYECVKQITANRFIEILESNLWQMK